LPPKSSGGWGEEEEEEEEDLFVFNNDTIERPRATTVKPGGTPRPPLTEMEDRCATVTDALQSTTFRLYSSAAAPVTGARHLDTRCLGAKAQSAVLRSSSLLSRVLVAQSLYSKLHCNIRSDNHNYRRNTPNTLFRSRITPLCQDVRDTIMVQCHGLAPLHGPLSKRANATLAPIYTFPLD
jgi:hypothetical protein